jgi:glycosyltransferase involved in cell wall biosynthesis
VRDEGGRRGRRGFPGLIPGVIVLDAAAVPDRFSGARTRLRGLLGAYARLPEAPRLVVRIARGAALLEGVALGSIAIEEAPRPGGPFRRSLTPRLRAEPDGPLVRAAKLWHSETIPPLQPRGVPALLTIHDLRWSVPRATTGVPFSKWAPRHLAAKLWLPGLARALAGIVTVSESSARAIETKLGVPRERVHLVRNADAAELAPRLADADERALLAKLRVEPRRFFVALGHLEPRKGLDLAIEALACAAKGGALEHAALVLIGAGEGEAALRAAAARLGVGERLRLAGPLDERATSSLLEQAAALLFPSRFEGFGFPVHEARARGLPVFARRIEPLLGFEGHEGDGVALLSGEPGSWTRAMEAELRRADATAGSPRPAPARGRTTWEDSARALAALYSRELAAPGRNRG